MPPLTQAQCQEVRHMKCWLIDKYAETLKRERSRNDSGLFKQDLDEETIVRTDYAAAVAAFFGCENVNWKWALFGVFVLLLLAWRLAEAFVWRRCGQFGGAHCHCYGSLMY